MGTTLGDLGLFSPTIISGFLEGTGNTAAINLSSLSGSNATGSNSYELDSPGDPLKSTQQLPIDWSDFSKHTFFNSAESKVNVSFDTIINYFPFDGERCELKSFLADLTGYENYVYGRWPKYVGFLHFSGTQKGEDPANDFAARLGTYTTTQDQAGALFPALSKDRSGEAVIDPGLKSISLEFFLHAAQLPNDNQVVVQKLQDGINGITICLSQSADAGQCNLLFLYSSGSSAMSASAPFPKGGFHHVAAVYSRPSDALGKLKIYLSGSLVSTSSTTYDFNAVNFAATPMYIGSGSAHDLGVLNSTPFAPQQTFSGAMDEFKIYHSNRTKGVIIEGISGSAYPSDDLKCYYKFNEPTGSYTNNAVILDSSGNSLHGQTSNYVESLREKKNLIDPILLESVWLSPALFPDQPDVVALNIELLGSGSDYDANNPNMITNLIPHYYLEEGALNEGFSTDEANTGDPYSYTTDFPGGGKIGSPQIIASILFTWAKFFDEIKMYIDQFGKLLKVEYDSEGTISDWLLPFLGKYYGFTLPNQFSNSSLDQYLYGDNLTDTAGVAAMSLQQIQNQIWRRILVNINDIIRSKGTIHGIKSLMRAAGISPDNIFRFREFGGSFTITTEDNRINRTEVSTMLNMTSSTSNIRSPFLSGSRIEVGFPYVSGTFVEKDKYAPHGISNASSDGLFTSASWTYESMYQFKRLILDSPATQSIARIFVTGSHQSTNKRGLVGNLVAFGTGSGLFDTGSLALYVRPGVATTAPTMKLVLTGVNIFDQNKWHISFGRNMGNVTSSFATASYFLRAGRQCYGNLVEYFETSSLFFEGTNHVWSKKSANFNASGSFLVIGSGTMGPNTGNRFLDSATRVTEDNARMEFFKGFVGHMRFWTLPLTTIEDKEHARNFKSVGVENPLLNYNFVTTKSGSFQRLRINVSTDQEFTQSNAAGSLSLFDFSQNNLHFTASNFPVSTKIIYPEQFNFSILNPKFDERSAANKIRVRGFEQQTNINEFKTLKSPVREIAPGTPVTDDTRFSLEIGMASALNDDIMNIIATLDFFDDALGDPALMYADSYPALANLRYIYFQRLTDRVNYKNLFEFFKWFDDSLAVIIENIIPRSTKFLGINFVVESHVLERAKMRYLQGDIYLGENDRRGLASDLFLQQIVGVLRRF